MILKVSLKSLKLGYVQVKTPKFPKPCSLACNCKITWVSDSGQIWGLPRKFQSYPLGEASRKIMLNFTITLLERPPEKSCSTSQFFREISWAPKLKNENIVYKAKQTSKFSYKGIPSNSKSSWFSVWAKRIKPKSGKHACTAREPSKSSYISKVELAD